MSEVNKNAISGHYESGLIWFSPDQSENGSIKTVMRQGGRSLRINVVHSCQSGCSIGTVHKAKIR